MDMSIHLFSDMFAQLGLANDDQSIADFLIEYSPIPDDIRLADASFWSPAQAIFLREAILHDADWAEVVDQLNSALRAPKNPP